MAIAEELGMNRSDLSKLRQHFKMTDMVRDDTLSVREFSVMNQFENEAFASLIFSVFDFDQGGTVTFEEFVIGLWSSLTLEDTELMAFTFRLFDKDNSGSLSYHELVKMLNIVCGNEKKGLELAQSLLKRNGKNDDGIMSYEEFVGAVKRSALLLFPAFEMRNRLRDAVLGTSRWKVLTRKRHMLFPHMFLDDIVKCLKNKPEGYRFTRDGDGDGGSDDEVGLGDRNRAKESPSKQAHGQKPSTSKRIHDQGGHDGTGDSLGTGVASAPGSRPATSERERDQAQQQRPAPAKWHKDSSHRPSEDDANGAGKSPGARRRRVPRRRTFDAFEKQKQDDLADVMHHLTVEDFEDPSDPEGEDLFVSKGLGSPPTGLKTIKETRAKVKSSRQIDAKGSEAKVAVSRRRQQLRRDRSTL